VCEMRTVSDSYYISHALAKLGPLISKHMSIVLGTLIPHAGPLSKQVILLVVKGKEDTPMPCLNGGVSTTLGVE
jgi:hypothetical protein